jgi:hypothetical protein
MVATGDSGRVFGGAPAGCAAVLRGC